MVNTIYTEVITKLSFLFLFQIYRGDSSNLLFWLLIFLALAIACAILALILCCICAGCPLYMPPRYLLHKYIYSTLFCHSKISNFKTTYQGIAKNINPFSHKTSEFHKLTQICFMLKNLLRIYQSDRPRLS